MQNKKNDNAITIVGHPEECPEPLQAVLQSAMAERASDVHIDPVAGGELVRLRVDGIVHEKELIPPRLRGRILTQLKAAAGLKIDRAFQPQEGDLVLRGNERARHVRVSLLPVGDHEAAHLRFLDAGVHTMDLGRIGLSEEHRERVTALLQRGQGLILVAGGTGTGKTTTLYALANALDVQRHVVASIEDPVEFYFPALRQLEVDASHGLTMHEGLRILLRMDPDALLIGEIRDQHSAVTAARAALAGRIVIATIHATDAAMAVDALRYYTVPRYVLGGSLRMIITQELLRRVCPDCARAAAPTDREKALFDRYGVPVPDTVTHAVACKGCAQYGYRGRTGIFEVTSVDEGMADAITRGATPQEFRQLAREVGVHPMTADALRKAAEGTVSMEEVGRFIQTR